MFRKTFTLALFIAACSDEAPSTIPAPTCATDAECDDGLACTLDRCLEGSPRVCAWEILPETCFVNGVCATSDSPHPNEPCLVCDPSTPDRWTPLENATVCDDGNACTSTDLCTEGVCAGTAISCNDDNACTRDFCEPATGCQTAVLTSFTCDDGVRCTIDDRCTEAAACAGIPNACDDGDPCTIDACNEVDGCTHTVEDGLACAGPNACRLGICQDGACTVGDSVNCDDGNSCTIDTCDDRVGCVHLPTLSPCCIGASSVCDDGNPCTDDACDALTGACSYANNGAFCDDLNPCTSGDQCAEGSCAGGLTSACDDENPCTRDSCNPSLENLCLHEPQAGPCDDGLECSTNDTCTAGTCRGDTSDCVCTPDLSEDGLKLKSVQIGTSGEPGEGIDVDQNPSTCAPAGSCSSGIDNTLSVIASFANQPLSDAVTNGQVLLVVEVGPLATNPVEIAVYAARLAPSNASCNFQNATCDYLVDPAFLDPVSCEPVARLVGTRNGNRLVAGGPGTRLPFLIPFGDASLEVVIANLRIEADLTLQNGLAKAMTGILGGAVPKQNLLDGLATVPDDALPVPRDALITLVESLVENDIDSDANGSKDAASIGVKLIAIDGHLVGVAN
jgi:hypothetical protein